MWKDAGVLEMYLFIMHMSGFDSDEALARLTEVERKRDTDGSVWVLYEDGRKKKWQTRIPLEAQNG